MKRFNYIFGTIMMLVVLSTPTLANETKTQEVDEIYYKNSMFSTDNYEVIHYDDLEIVGNDSNDISEKMVLSTRRIPVSPEKTVYITGIPSGRILQTHVTVNNFSSLKQGKEDERIIFLYQAITGQGNAIGSKKHDVTNGYYYGTSNFSSNYREIMLVIHNNYQRTADLLFEIVGLG